MAYLFSHFREKITPDGEQVYFALSKDGFNWTQLNNGEPILTSTMGEKGCRDIEVISRTDRQQYHSPGQSGNTIGRKSQCNNRVILALRLSWQGRIQPASLTAPCGKRSQLSHQQGTACQSPYPSRIWREQAKDSNTPSGRAESIPAGWRHSDGVFHPGTAQRRTAGGMQCPEQKNGIPGNAYHLRFALSRLQSIVLIHILLVL